MATAMDPGRVAGDLLARPDAAVLHPHPRGGLGDVEPPRLAGAAHQRRAVQRESAAAVLVDPRRLAGDRRQRHLAARTRGDLRRHPTGAGVGAGAAPVPEPPVGGQGRAVDPAGAGLCVPVRPADHVRGAAGRLGAGGAALPDAQAATRRATLGAVWLVRGRGSADQGPGDVSACGLSVRARPAMERLGARQPGALVQPWRARTAAGWRHAAGLGVACRFRRRRGVSPAPVLHPDCRPRGECVRSRPSVLVVCADDPGAAVPLQRLAARLGGAGHAAPTARQRPAFRAVLAGAGDRGVLLHQRQAAVLPAA